MTENNKPANKYKYGSISITLWENKGKTKDGREYSFKTCQYQRGYKDVKGQWANTTTLRVNDIPKVIAGLQKAYEEMISTDNENEE